MAEIWYRDMPGFFSPRNMWMFFPTKDMPLADSLNAVSRLSLYFGVLMFITTANHKYVYATITGFAITASVYKASKQKDIISGFSTKECRKPTKDNPMMNVTLDAYDNPEKLVGICDPLDASVKEDIEAKFNESIIKNGEDVFMKESSERQFYTTPNTLIPNKQGEFANWLYGSVTNHKANSIYL
jgi:hypothetical protein